MQTIEAYHDLLYLELKESDRVVEIWISITV